MGPEKAPESTGLGMRMKESYKEPLAIDFGHNPYAGSGDAPGVAWVICVVVRLRADHER